MRHHPAILLPIAAASLAVALGTSAALASSAAATYSGTGKVTLSDTTSSNSLTCSSTIGGAYSTKPANGIASVTKIAFTKCIGPEGISFTVTAGGLPWKATATSTSGTTEKGKISGISLTGSGDGCTAKIDGTSGTGSNGVVEFSYTFGTGKLKFLTTGGNLHIYNSTGCLGLINNGDTVTMGATYTIKAA